MLNSFGKERERESERATVMLIRSWEPELCEGRVILVGRVLTPD